MFKAYFITCLVPFQIEESSYAIAEEDHATLLASLVYETRKLHEALCANWVSLRWCTEAMILVKKMHAEFLRLFQSLNLKVSMVSWDGTSKLLDEYMKMSLNILEFCNLLKSAISDVNRHILKIEIAVRCMPEIEFLAKEMDRQEMKLYGIPKWENDDNVEIPMQKKKNKANGISIICAIRGAITIICSILLSVICHPIPVEIDEEIHSEVPQLKLFVDSIEDLAKCFNKKSNIAPEDISLAFLENIIEKRAKVTKSQFKRQSSADRERSERIKATIRQELASRKTGLEKFESEVAKLFEEVLEGRSKLMRQITATNKT